MSWSVGDVGGGLTIEQAGDRIVGDESGDLVRRPRAVGPEPMRGPVEGAEERAGHDGGVGAAEGAVADARRHESADAPLVAVALDDDARAEARGQSVHLEVRRRAFHLVHQTQHVRDGDVAQPRRQGAGVAPGGRQRGEQAVERAILAEEQEFVLAAEIVIEIAGRQIGGDRDVAHAGGGEAAGAEDARGGAHDLDPAGVGAFRTTVRKVNHGSILPELSLRRDKESVAADRRPGAASAIL